MTTLVDTNVILDVVTDDPTWAAWSADHLGRALDDGMVVINPIIYAEVSSGFQRIEEVEAALPGSLFHREPLPWPAGFVAGKAFVDYRKRGGPRRSPLPDFYIGAHAAFRGYTLLTRDRARYSTYFPGLEIVAPGGAGGAPNP